MTKQTQQTLAIIFVIVSGIAGFVLSLYFHQADSLPPAIPTNVPNELRTFHNPVSFVAQLKGDPDAGEKIFKSYCVSCHGSPPKIPIQAPRIGDHKVWRALASLGKKRLLHITVNGVGAMPARGGCFECSDEQLMMTIEYMLKNSKVKGRVD